MGFVRSDKQRLPVYSGDLWAQDHCVQLGPFCPLEGTCHSWGWGQRPGRLSVLQRTRRPPLGRMIGQPGTSHDAGQEEASCVLSPGR